MFPSIILFTSHKQLKTSAVSASQAFMFFSFLERAQNFLETSDMQATSEAWGISQGLDRDWNLPFNNESNFN